MLKQNRNYIQVIHSESHPAGERELARTPTKAIDRLPTTAAGFNLEEPFPPHLTLAPEAMPASFLKERVDELGRKAKDDGRLASAWAQIEYSICRQSGLTNFEKRELLSNAVHLLDMVPPTRGNLMGQLQNDYLVLRSYVPLFTKRAFETPISSEDCQQLYVSLTRLLELNKTYCSSTTTQSEVFTMALAARTQQPELLLYPEASYGEHSTNRRFNKDCYFKTASGGKIPVQIKSEETSQEYEQPIQVFHTTRFVTAALRKQQRLASKFPGVAVIELGDYKELVDIAIREGTQDATSDFEKMLLDAATAEIVQLVKPRRRVS